MAEYLYSRGIVRDIRGLRVRELKGGVSSVVLAVEGGDVRLVVKQARSRFQVRDEWIVKRERAITEARAIEFTRSATPDAVPKLVHVDEEAFALVVELAPAGWLSWKTQLLKLDANPVVAERAGKILAKWHGSSWQRRDIAEIFDDTPSFEQQRLDPYYRTVMKRHPEVAARLESYVEMVLANPRCFVHGDFSPKNVLVGPGGLWIVDYEVAHWGDPSFDLAFMLNHLMLKSIHLESGREAYLACAMRLWNSYSSALDGMTPPEISYVLGQTGCLMLARVAGKSPAEYLTASQKVRAWSHGSKLLDPPDSIEGAWPAA